MKLLRIVFKLSLRSIHFLIVLLLIIGVLSVNPVKAAGEAGYALSFDGENDYVALGNTADILGANWKTTKSISVWIKPTGDGQLCYDNDVANCDAVIVDQPHFFGISRGIVSGQDQIWVWNFDGATKKIGVPYEIDQWVHITLVHADGSLKMFRNGNLINSIASGATLLGSDVTLTKLQLGALLNPPKVAAYQGFIDEVRIYSIELTEQLIVDTLRTHLFGDETGLEAYYQMSDGEGNILTDNSNNDWTGVLNDGTPYVDPDGTGPSWVSSSAFDFPVGDDQIITVQEDDINIPITLTGSSPNSSNITFVVTTVPFNGTLNGTVPNLTYTPSPNYNGSDQFSFYINDGIYNSSPATISITVDSVNDAPVATLDNFQVTMNEELVINAPGVLTNDSDVDGDSISTDLVSNVTQGNLVLNSDGSFTYTPGSGYIGLDSFEYRVSDGIVYSNSVVVSIEVLETSFYIYLPIILR